MQIQSLQIDLMSETFFQTLSRVYTFKVGRWPYIQVKQLCPYRLASMGYFVSSPFKLQCFVCHNKVSISQQFDSTYKDEIQQISKHKENCIYHENQDLSRNVESQITKQKIYLLMDQITVQLKEQHTLLNELKLYPALNKNQIQKYLKEDNFTFKFIDESHKLNWSKQIKISFFLQFFGWTIKRNQQKQDKISAFCALCGRNSSLENIQMLPKDQQDKSLNIEQQKCFNPISEHRYFCFWVNPKCSGYCGYSIYLQHLYDKINQSKSLFSKRSPNQTKKIRVELDKYLQSFQQKTNQQFQKIKTIFNECQQSRLLIADQLQKDNKPFKEIHDRMEQFTEGIGEQFKKQLKKIKLN